MMPPSAPPARSNGIVESWDDMQLIWEHTFRDVLQVDPASGCRIM